MRSPVGLAVVAVVVLAFQSVGGAVAQGPPSALAIMEKNRELHRARDEEETLAVKIVDRRGAVKQRRLVRYTATGADGLSKVLVRFTAPRDIANTGLLIWEARTGDDDQWLYLPGVKKVKRIAASGKKNRFMGTDFAYEDLRPESLAVHTYTLAGSEALDSADCWVIEATPATERQAADSGYTRRRIWIRKDNHVTVKREFYDKQNRLEKVELHRTLVNVAGTVWRANEVEMQDVQAGTRTVVSIEARAINRGLRDDFFTETELIR